MHERLIYSAAMCRIGGCFWIENFQRKSLDNAKVTWRSLYSIYSALVIIYYLGMELSFLIPSLFVLSDVARKFSLSLIAIVHSVLTLKAGTNYLSMLCSSRKLLAFFQRSADFEKSSGFPTRTRRATREHPWHFARRIGVLITAAIVFVLNIYAAFENTQVRVVSEWRLVFNVCSVLSIGLFLLYDSLPYIVLSSACEVLADYLEVQVQAFQDRMKFRDVHSKVQAPSEIESVRLVLGEIGDMKRQINDIWQSTLISTSGTLLFVLCVVLYTLFGVGVILKHVLLYMSYAVYTTFCFLEIVIVSQGMRDKVSTPA